MAYQAQVIHHIPGRVRVRLPGARGNHALLRQIKDSLAPQPGVQRVEVNPATGSLLVHYDPDLHEDYHSRLARYGEREDLFALKPPELTEADEIANKIEAEAEYLAAHSETARAVVNFVKHLNEGVKQATSNMVDLKVLLPLGLAIYTFKEAGSGVVTPLWVTLGIFSFNSFVALHHPKPSLHVDDHEIVLDKSQPPPPAKKGRSGRTTPRKRR